MNTRDVLNQHFRAASPPDPNDEPTVIVPRQMLIDRAFRAACLSDMSREDMTHVALDMFDAAVSE